MVNNMTDNKPAETLEAVDKLGKSIDRFISAVEEATVARDKANTMFAQLANTELPMSEVLHQMDKQKAWQVLQLLYAAEYIETGNLKKAISIVEDYPEQNAMQQDGLREILETALHGLNAGYQAARYDSRRDYIGNCRNAVKQALGKE